MRVIGAIVVLLLSILVTVPVPASAPYGEVVAGSLTRGGAIEESVSARQAQAPLAANPFYVYVPFVGRHSDPCSSASPFSLQIAALHEIVPGTGQEDTLRTLTEAQWLAWYEEAFPTLLQALKESGACWTRLRVDWAWIQPDPPPAAYVWGPYHDEKLALVAEAGVQLIAHVDDVPGWAGDSPNGPIAPDRLDDFAQFLTDLVNRYKQPPYNIHHWELFNEPDWTDRSGTDYGWGYNGYSYAQMLAVAYPAIKAADPEATVLMGGVAYDWFVEHGGPFYRYFPDDVMGNGGAGYLDVANFHYFPDFAAEWERWDPGSPERESGYLPAPTCGNLYDGQGIEYEAGGVDLIAKASHFRNRLSACFGVDKPVWITELGEHGYADDTASLTRQARYVIQGYARGLAAGATNITWFALVSPPYDPFGQGLLFKDSRAPKPAFYAYQTLTSELSGYAYAHTLDAPGVEGYVFRDSYGDEKTVAWTRPWESGSLIFAPATSLRVVDREGTVTFVRDGGADDADGVENGAVELEMAPDPVFVSE